ncbi:MULTISPECIES: hypothetical protein [Vibrio harveyi group]|uniref:hypothetical protein n=1 Tax=Vibrio harveyi group TaxID=717610 RepID=UPI0005F00141|nr:MULTISPECIES: hypothetical protein [Vibrio harveyi group]
MKPLSWLLGLLLTATLASFTFPNSPVPQWVLICLVAMDFLAFVLFAFAYLFFMIKDPDALRSEKFNIEKMAIQQGMTGDSEHGVLEEKVVPSTKHKEISATDTSSGQGGNS